MREDKNHVKEKLSVKSHFQPGNRHKNKSTTNMLMMKYGPQISLRSEKSQRCLFTSLILNILPEVLINVERQKVGRKK